jgi:hypothetical protein
MPRQFKTEDYEQALDTSVRLRDVSPSDHLAYFVADIVAQLDLAAFYARYVGRGESTPGVVIGLLGFQPETAAPTGARLRLPRNRQEQARFGLLLQPKRACSCWFVQQPPAYLLFSLFSPTGC